MATPFFTCYTCCSNLSDSIKHGVTIRSHKTEYATLYDLVADVLQAEGKIIDPPKIHSQHGTQTIKIN